MTLFGVVHLLGGVTMILSLNNHKRPPMEA
jgi:hypothetical protein